MDADSVGAWYEVNVFEWVRRRKQKQIFRHIFFQFLSHGIFLTSTGTGPHCAPLPWAAWQGQPHPSVCSLIYHRECVRSPGYRAQFLREAAIR